ncbi:SARP family transcriptional regulator, partial [Streptomyces sp. SID7499]|nr:SARP family transcriptional regulator [Streptomyces sp. SID7499]
ERPEEASAVLAGAREFRSALYACLTEERGRGDGGAFARVAEVVQDAMRRAVFVQDEDGLGRWSPHPESGPSLPLYAVAQRAADLLADPR